MSVQAGAQTGSGPKFASDLDGSSDNWQFVKLAFGPIGTYTIASLTNGFPIQPATGAAFPVTQSGAWTIATLPALPAGTNLIGQVTANPPVVDGATFTEATSVLMPIGGVCNETLVGSLGEDKVGAPRVTPKRAWHVNLRDNSGVEFGTSGNPVIVSDGSGSLTVDGTVAASQSGAWSISTVSTITNVVHIDDNSGSITVDNAGTFAVQDKPATSGGLSMSKTVSAATTNATSVKASAGQVYAIQVFNSNAAARYLKLYNKASAPTVGTDTPVKVFMIPTGGGAIPLWDKGLAFSTGIAFATTTGAADNDTGAVAAAEIIVNIDYV
jgi:hypothetical protein